MDLHPECWSWWRSVQVVTLYSAFYTVCAPHRCCLTHILLSCLAHLCRGLLEDRFSAPDHSPHQNHPHSHSRRCTIISSWCKSLHTVENRSDFKVAKRQFNSTYSTWLALELGIRALRRRRLDASSICQTELPVSHRTLAGGATKLAKDFYSPRPSLRVRKSKLTVDKRKQG